MIDIALLLIGFSLVDAIVLALTHFRAAHYREQQASRIMGLLLLAALSGLQLGHFAWLQHDLSWVTTPAYQMLLFAVAPTFYLFSRPLLHPPAVPPKRSLAWAHALPVAIAPRLDADTALLWAFIAGAAYMSWLMRSVYVLRRERARFRLELALLGAVIAIAIGVAALGLVRTWLPGKLFFEFYAISIGLAFFLVQTTLGLSPQLSVDVSEAARVAYANSTLVNVDCDVALRQLGDLMQNEHIYAEPELALPNLAARVGLSSHQLSELINSRLGKGFSRYLREQRIAAAKAMLCAEPSASVLSVGLSVGFKAQSNFYEAFREIEGMTPGQYRKLHCGGASR